MRHLACLALISALGLSACSHGTTTAPLPPKDAWSVFVLNPSPVELSNLMASAVVNGQGDTPGVVYTPHAAANCTGASGSTIVAGDGVGQTDVAGSPLMFLVVATGTPPSDCTVTVSGSDGTSASTDATYQIISATDPLLRSVAPQRVSMSPAGVTPTSVTISQADQTASVAAAGFTGSVTEKTSCTGNGGITVSPSSFSGSATVVVAPYGQGALNATCTVTFTDSANVQTRLGVTLGTPLLNKLTITPGSVQFTCSNSNPKNCASTAPVSISESGAAHFQINNRPGLHSCATAFSSPLTMSATGGASGLAVPGPQATVTFGALLAGSSLSCSKIIVTDSGSPAQNVAIAVNSTLLSGGSAATAPSCAGPDARVADSTAPHGMFVWNPYGVETANNYENVMESQVIGKDKTLCGVSLVVQWSDVEATRGQYTWQPVQQQLLPYAQAGLRVNLLFVAASEVGVGKDAATPAWVFNQDGVAKVNCSGQPYYPNFIDPTFEKDWESFITAAVQHFSDSAALGTYQYASQVGYIRFGLGAGAEAYPGHFSSSNDCYNQWVSVAGWTYAKWQQHALNIVNYMGHVSTDKQLMVALNNIQDDPNAPYGFSNAVARVAASYHIGFGTENLGIAHIADTGVTPAPCNPVTNKLANIYWCQAFTRHMGAVPFQFQPIRATTPDSPVASQYPNLDFANLLQYALDNNAQILELYPQEWIAADDPSAIPGGIDTQSQAEHRTALDNASLILGAAP